LFTANVSETFKHHSTVDVKGSFKDDVALLGSTLPTPKTPASFAYRLDSKEGGKYEWMMITFVPDDAGVCLRDIRKMGSTDV
jgi:twinfilin-like protein